MVAGDSGAGVPVGLLDDGVDPGPLGGLLVGDEVRVPESALRRHALVVGRSGVGKSTLVKHVVGHFLEQRARGVEGRVLVLVDPSGDVVRDVVRRVPEGLSGRVRLLDFRRRDRVPGINLVDPLLFPDREGCVAGIVRVFRDTWEHWGGGAEECVGNGLRILHEYNSRPETSRDEMLTVLDLLSLLDEGRHYGSGDLARWEPNPFQRHVLARVSDAWLVDWFRGFLCWESLRRSRAVQPVYGCLGAYASDRRARVVLGQGDSTVSAEDLFSRGSVVLVSTGPGVIGRGPAALLGNAMLSLVEAEGRRQVEMPPAERSGLFLVCEGFGAVSGVDWGVLLGEARKLGCSVMLSTQSLYRLGAGEVVPGVLGNVGCLVGYQMLAEDGRVIAGELDSERVGERDLVNLDPHRFVLRVSSDEGRYPAFRVRGLGPFGPGEDSLVVEDSVLQASESYTREWGEASAGVSLGRERGIV